MNVTVYSQPNCQPCKATIRTLTALGVEHEVVNIQDDPEAAEFVRGLGHQQTPVVVVDDEYMESWSGHRPEQLASLG